ncbi:MAG: hypothetical protein AAGI38_19535 [Bacteroidota bacterium]
MRNDLSADQIYAYLTERLHPRLSGQAFTHMPVLKQFRRTRNTGFQNIIFSVSEYEDVNLVEIHFGIRLENIERISNRYLPVLPAFARHSHTLIISHSKLTGRPYHRYKVGNEVQLERMGAEVEHLCMDQGVMALADHGSFEAAHTLLNESPETVSDWVPNQAHRCFKGLILASMVEPSIFEPLARTYLSILRNEPQGTLLEEKFLQLINQLRGVSLN